MSGPAPFALAAGEGEHLHFSGADFIVRASGETTGGAFSVIEEVDALDTPLHVHEHEDELFYVLDGEHEFRVGDEVVRAGPGAVVYGPRGVPHAHRRIVPRRGSFLAMFSPPGLEGFFRDLAAAERAGTIGPEIYAEVSRRYGIVWL